MGLKEIYKKLNMTHENGLCVVKGEQWKGKLPKRLEDLIDKKLKPEAFFCFDKKPLILFYDSPLNKQKLFKAIWNFNETPIVIINEADSIEIYNGFSYLKDKSALDKFEDSKNLNNFSYFELVTGKSLEQYQAKLKQQNRVDSYLLENIQDARDSLINDYSTKDSLANALIGKCIFVRYLIDRGVRIKFDGQSRKWTNNEFCDLFDNKAKLIEFFKYLRRQFNGEAFLRNDNKLKEIPKKAFSVLKNLLMGTQLSSGQLSLFDIYNFSIIPVEFISNVYEHFIGKENQAEKGAYYTPKFLVDYILSETVEKYFQENSEQYNCKVLDPACGSGIFLVEALRRIVERYKDLNNNKITKRILKQLAENNIFGIDKDKDAVNVAIFSVYLALLDYQEPKDIEDFKFPNLMKNSNFHTADFFDTNAKYNSLFRKNNFDFILGNPPWKRGASQDNPFLQYITTRKQKESNKKDNGYECVTSNKEIAQAFLLRTSDFSSEKTKCALIVSSKTLYNLNAEKFRKYFLYNFFIDKVFELAPGRREIFDKSNDKAIAPAAILFFRYSYGKDTASNELIHLCLKPNRLFSLFKIFVLQNTDIKRVVQKRLMKYDWLWKVLVYGSYLDFNFISRLKKDYKTIENIIDDKNNYLVKQGLKRKDGKKKVNVKELIGWDFLDINKRGQIKPFFIIPQLEKWTEKCVGYIYRENEKIVEEVFTPPVLLLKETVDVCLRSVPVISLERKILFTDKVTSIKAVGNNKELNYYKLAGLLYSSLFSYFILLKSSTVGIMIEQQVNDKEKWGFPYIDNFEIEKIVKQIEDIAERLYREEQKPLNSQVSTITIESKKQKLVNQLNEEIFKSFDLNKQELALVDYAINITIPLIMRHKGYEKLFSPIPFSNKLLKEYIKIFLSRFENSFKEKHLKAEIWHTNNIVGVFFKVVSNNSSDKQLIVPKEKKNKEFLRRIISLGTVKVTESLFVQKDIRGFEKKGFYIIKPNEKKLWHKAIAYLDVDEIMDAILKAGKEVYYGQNT